MTPWIGSPSAMACESRLSSTMPAPSPRTKPLAEASNAAQRPSGESIPACENPIKPPGVIITVTPPASAMSPRPARMCSHATWTAVSAEEQAVSIATLGPRRFRQYEMRFAAMECAVPVGECWLIRVVLERRPLDALIVVVRDADKHAEISPFLEIEHDPGVFDRFPRGLQEQPLLRVHVGRLARRDAEELRVKLVDLLQKAAALGEGFARDAGFRIVVALDVPAVGRDFRDGFAAGDEQLPEGFRVIDSSRKTAADSDDGDTIFGHGKNKWPRTGRGTSNRKAGMASRR